MFTNLYHDIDKAIEKAKKDTDYMRVAGLSPEDTETGCYPYDEVERELLAGLERVRGLKNHAHQWNGETMFCEVCGADGNA